MIGQVCPLCRRRLSAIADRCPRCQGDLRLLFLLGDLANWHFNQAVAAAREQRWRTAGEHLAVTLALSPDDVAGLVVLGKIRCRQGLPGDAVQLWKRAQELAPDRVDIRRAIESFGADGRKCGPA